MGALSVAAGRGRLSARTSTKKYRSMKTSTRNGIESTACGDMHSEMSAKGGDKGLSFNVKKPSGLQAKPTITPLGPGVLMRRGRGEGGYPWEEGAMRKGGGERRSWGHGVPLGRGDHGGGSTGSLSWKQTRSGTVDETYSSRKSCSTSHTTENPDCPNNNHAHPICHQLAVSACGLSMRPHGGCGGSAPPGCCVRVWHGRVAWPCGMAVWHGRVAWPCVLCSTVCCVSAHRPASQQPRVLCELCAL